MDYFRGNVLGADQMGEFRKRLCPSQFLEDRAQINEQVVAGCGGQRRRLRAQARHPAEEVWIAAQLIERAHLMINGSEVSQELADGLDMPDEYLPRIVTALEHYSAYARAVQREDARYQEAADWFKPKQSSTPKEPDGRGKR